MNDTTPAQGTSLWSDDQIYESIDRFAFDVLHEGRIVSVLNRVMAEACVMAARDSFLNDRVRLIAEADTLRYALDFAVEQNEEMTVEIDNIRQENSTLFDRAALRLAELKATQAELAESQAYALQLERALGEAWEPVEDGIHNTDGPEVLFIKEKLLSIVGEHYVYLPQGYALCRRISSSPTAGEGGDNAA